MTLRLLECCFDQLEMSIRQALVLLRRSEFASSRKKFAWFALKAEAITVVTSSGHSNEHYAGRRNCTHPANRFKYKPARIIDTSNAIPLRPSIPLPSIWSILMDACRKKPLRPSLSLRPTNLVVSLQKRPQGYRSSEFCAHSLRSGQATHMCRSGVGDLTIQFHKRWASDTSKQYT
ncbi:hypothetical protein PHMEG_0004281 [Phytophthora megakarya]|uniref:Uncharacterized protein n=1 Tax=Phytophthora megakarya TaxID=4795 RepID=A0A225WVR6_9STRA|nr:hypothetical protein PHMEG_0004281 [Phytophthora megakarya]